MDKIIQDAIDILDEWITDQLEILHQEEMDKYYEEEC